MKKKLITLLLALGCVFGVTGMTACGDIFGDSANSGIVKDSSVKLNSSVDSSSSEEEEPATPTEGLKYTLSGDKTHYIVSGIGTATDTDIVIPATYNNLPVKEIGSSAFYNCNSLTSVRIPDSVTTIGYGAFSSCDSLTSITIGDSVTSIGDAAFGGCSSLTSITIGDSVTTIGIYAFDGCSSLTSVIIPDSVTSIGGSAFYGCDSLISVTIPDSVTSIGELAFNDCSKLTSVTFENPNGWTATNYNYSTTTKKLSATYLADTATAARYLKSTYCYYAWTREEN